jgi:hypothetical protein
VADLEQEVFDAGAAEAPSPDLAPSPQPSVSPPSDESRALTDAISAVRGPVPNYGTQPHAPAPPPPPPNPDDQPVTASALRDLLSERSQRQRLEAQVRDFQAREQERQRQQAAPKTEDLLFQDPEAFKRQMTDEFEKKIAHMRLDSDMQMAAMRHGPTFDAAWQHFHQTVQNGADGVSWYRVMSARSPGEEMVRWFNERRMLPRGEDGRFQPQQQPRHEVRLPSSLSRMNGTSRGVDPNMPEDGSEEAIFDAGRPRAKN